LIIPRKLIPTVPVTVLVSNPERFPFMMIRSFEE
jgi:hypothetical protein